MRRMILETARGAATVAAVFAAQACKTPHQSASIAQSDDAAGVDASAGNTTSASSAVPGELADNPFEAGFAISRLKDCQCPAPGAAWTDDTWQFAVADDRGLLVPDASRSTGLALDTGKPIGEPDSTDIVFRWPAATEAINRDYDRLGALMTEYSNLVGTCDGTGTGAGEKTWTEWMRSDQMRILEETIYTTRDSTRWCEEVVRQLVDRYVPTGSRYRQYGNCGEGGRVGACLAKRAGFLDNEVRLCRSANDHFFSMVFRGYAGSRTNQRWCILDRWNVNGSGNFVCGFDYDAVRKVVTRDGQPVATTAGWYEKVTCASVEAYFNDSAVLGR